MAVPDQQLELHARGRGAAGLRGAARHFDTATAIAGMDGLVLGIPTGAFGFQGRGTGWAHMFGHHAHLGRVHSFGSRNRYRAISIATFRAMHGADRISNQPVHELGDDREQ